MPIDGRWCSCTGCTAGTQVSYCFAYVSATFACLKTKQVKIIINKIMESSLLVCFKLYFIWLLKTNIDFFTKEPTLYLIKGIVVLDNDGNRILAKVCYTSPWFILTTFDSILNIFLVLRWNVQFGQGTKDIRTKFIQQNTQGKCRGDYVGWNDMYLSKFGRFILLCYGKCKWKWGKNI